MDWQTFTSSWGFNYAFWAATVLAIVGLAVTLWLRSRSQLAYDIHHSTVVGQGENPFMKRIQITFDGIEIPRATMSSFHIWNDGNTTLRRTDIAPKKPLMFSLSDGQSVLQSSVRSMADEAMDVAVHIDDKGRALLCFEYIEPNTGFVCDILHTGRVGDVRLVGTLIGARPLLLTEMPKNTSIKSEIPTMLLACVLLGFLIYTVPQMTPGKLPYIFGWLMIGICPVYILFNLYLWLQGLVLKEVSFKP